VNFNHQKTDSHNDSSTNDSGNTKTTTVNYNHQRTDSHNDSSTHTTASNNTIASGNTKTIDSNNTDNSTHSYTDNSTHSINKTLSTQDLEGTVTGIRVHFDSANGGAGGAASESQPGGNGGSGDQNGQLTTGNISIDGASFAAFAGVQTASFSTGLGALNQSATSLAANANISFGP
jgi:hypothetical protein